MRFIMIYFYAAYIKLIISFCNMHAIMYYLLMLLLVNKNLIMSNICLYDQKSFCNTHMNLCPLLLFRQTSSQTSNISFYFFLQTPLPSRSGAKPNFLVSLRPLSHPQPICLNVSQLTRAFWSCITPYVHEKPACHSSVGCGLTSASASMLLQCWMDTVQFYCS